MENKELTDSVTSKWKLDKNSYKALALTYFAYFSLYVVRKASSTSKPYIKQELEICDKLTLGIIDNCHLIPYGLAAIMFPNLMNRLKGRKGSFFVFFGTGLAIASVFFVKFLGGSHIFQYMLICTCIFISGFFQSFGWPAVVKSLSENIHSEPIKALIPPWQTCCFFGGMSGGIVMGIIYSLFGSKQVDTNVDQVLTDLITGESCNQTNILYRNVGFENDSSLVGAPMVEWRYSFLIPALVPLFMAFLIIFIMPDGTRDLEEQQILSSNKRKINTENDLTFIQLFREVPAIIQLCLAYAFAKGPRYWYFYWAPDWLVEKGEFNADEAAFLSTAIDVGNIIGLLVAGPLTSKNRFVKKPFPALYAAALSSILCIPVMFLAPNIVNTQNIYAVSSILFLIGFFLVISDPIFAGVSAIEAANIHGKNCRAGISGIINCVGTIGASILLPLASWFAESNYFYAIGVNGFSLVLCAVLSVFAHKALEEAKRSLEEKELPHNKSGLLVSEDIIIE